MAEEENKEEKPEEKKEEAPAEEVKPEETKPKTEQEIKLEIIKKILDDGKKEEAVEVVEGEPSEEKKEEAPAEGDENFFKQHKNAIIFTGIAVAVILIILIAVRFSSPTGNAVQEFDVEKEIENLDREEELYTQTESDDAKEEIKTTKKTIKKTEEESPGIMEKIKEKFQALFATEEKDDFEEIDEILYEDEDNATKELANIKDKIIEGIAGLIE